MWAPALNPRGLSQGDVLKEVPVGAPWVPLVYLSKTYFPRKMPEGPPKLYYPKRDALEPFHPVGDPAGLFITKGRLCHALVINHNCDLDDADDTGRILLAPIWPLAFMGDANKEQQQRIMEGARRTFVPLPNVPKVGDCYADLGSIAAIDRELFTEHQRECSMTDEAVVRLRMQLLSYFTRLDPAQVKAALEAGLVQENKT